MRSRTTQPRPGTMPPYARPVVVAISTAATGASARAIRRAVESARVVVLDRETARVADGDSIDDMTTSALVLRLHDILDTLEEDGPDAALAALGVEEVAGA